MIESISLNEEEVSEILTTNGLDEEKMTALDSEAKQRLAWMLLGVEEVVGLKHIASIFSGSESHFGDNIIRCYVGYEPSGKAHIGWLVQALTLRRILQAGGNVLIFLADWHAWVNDKFDGNLEKIKITAQYMQEVFRTLLGNPSEGEGSGELRFLYASELADNSDYWARVISCAKGSTLAQARKTLSIMGREEDEADSDLSKFFYPAMQAADIFEMKIDIALGGMDQRKAHMYMRDVGDKYGWIKATCFHTPIISSLKKSGTRMESFDHKMSKSNPSSAILLHDEHEILRKKLRKAYLDPQDEHSPIYELIEYIIIPEHGKITVTPKPEYGEQSTYNSISQIRNAISSGDVHPLDVKFAVADAIYELLKPLSKFFTDNPNSLEAVNELTE